ncbi:hypothetical protein M8J75_006804 [Diaphorina citri]|nr:hypothetical protein M8J75_006804 [Diaphorina citri]
MFPFILEAPLPFRPRLPSSSHPDSPPVPTPNIFRQIVITFLLSVLEVSLSSALSSVLRTILPRESRDLCSDSPELVLRHLSTEEYQDERG